MTPDQYRILYHCARRMYQSHADAQDLVQDVAIKELTHNPNLPGEEQTCWLVVVMRNMIYTKWRKQRWQSVKAHMLYCPTITDCAGEASVLLDQLKRTSITRDQLTACKLAAEGYGHHEIADITRVAVGTVKSRIDRGRKALSNA